VVEWADVVFYLFSLGLIAVALVIAIVTYGPDLAHSWR
jgi:hypothetical protein